MSKYGGGFTVYSGTASAHIVSTGLFTSLPNSPRLPSYFSLSILIFFTEYMIDDCYKDFTHIAHELGHVLGLPHPTAGISSTNTLMCPSGYCNDNPQRNSYVSLSLSLPLSSYRSNLFPLLSPISLSFSPSLPLSLSPSLPLFLIFCYRRTNSTCLSPS